MRRAPLLLAALVCACNPQPSHPPSAATAQPSPASSPSALPPLRITSHGTAQQPIRIYETEKATNRRLYVLLASSYESRSAAGAAQAVFQNADVTFYAKDGTTLRARAPQASLNEQTRQVIMSGGVHATTSRGVTLACDRLVYDRASGTISGNGNVRMTGMQGSAQTVLTGTAFTSDVTLTQMQMR